MVKTPTNLLVDQGVAHGPAPAAGPAPAGPQLFLMIRRSPRPQARGARTLSRGPAVTPGTLRRTLFYTRTLGASQIFTRARSRQPTTRSLARAVRRLQPDQRAPGLGCFTHHQRPARTTEVLALPLTGDPPTGVTNLGKELFGAGSECEPVYPLAHLGKNLFRPLQTDLEQQPPEFLFHIPSCR